MNQKLQGELWEIQAILYFIMALFLLHDGHKFWGTIMFVWASITLASSVVKIIKANKKVTE